MPRKKSDNFWHSIKKPVIGLSPMDGVTDEPFRQIAAKYGHPDVIFTEFVPAEGISVGAERILKSLIYKNNEKPVIAQLFGSNPDSFYKAAFLICALGFDGVDINMGCPALNISTKGAGAALIQKPLLAQKIIRKVREATMDFHEGRKIGEIGLPDPFLKKAKIKKQKSRPLLPVSVKTRTGCNKNNIEEWIKYLLEESPDAISIHGRTLKQMYREAADYEAIGEAAKIAKGSGTLILGNGDVKSIKEAKEKTEKYGLDGILIGRAALGNPWVFCGKEASLKEKFMVAAEHAHLYEKIFKGQHFVAMRKHLAWYCSGFAGASETRQKLMFANNAKDVESILKKALSFTKSQ
jgi:tRNA-dihydrouridine synthase B